MESSKVSTDSQHIKFNNIFEPIDTQLRRTKIYCTLGPACNKVEQLVKMIDAGMNVARLNFSHGDHVSHGKQVECLNEALAQRPDKHVALLLDTKGPEIRTGMLVDGKNIELKKDQALEITTDYTIKGDNTKISCSYPHLATSVKVGSTIFIADGSLTCIVTELKEKSVMVKVLNDAKIGERKNMNLPGCHVDLPILSEKDQNDITEFGLKHNIDMIAASFVQSAENIQFIRSVLGARGAHVKIISKIENQAGLNNFDAILEACDGIMVARGDLGMEIPPEKVFIAQKWMIEKCNLKGKPVVTATQMLESMINAPRPTRAEASDVANAVLDGSDAVMLSGESANGAYPVEAVTVMARTCCEAERCYEYKKHFDEMKMYTSSPLSTNEAVASAAVSAVLDLNIDLVIVLTDTGAIARLISKYRPPTHILACSVVSSVVRQMSTTRGVTGFKIPSYQGQADMIKVITKAAKDQGLIKSGAKVVCVLSQNEETPDESNIMKVVDVE